MAKPLWRGTASSFVLRWVLLAIFAATMVFIALVNAFTSDPAEQLHGAEWIAPISVMLVGVVVALWSSRVAVEVDDAEMRVIFGAGWPVRHIRWDRVRTVDVLDVRPMQWGGWGYRVNSLKRSSAMVLRAGEGLRVTFDNERVFVVTVDRAKQGLEVIRKVLATK